MTKIEIKNMLYREFPEARKGFIDVLIDALELHTKKNHDYNSKENIDKYNTLEKFAKFIDIRRKYSRTENIMSNDLGIKVEESLEETSIDLGVYAFLFCEYLKNSSKQSNGK